MLYIMSIQRNFINQDPNGKFGRWNISSIDHDNVKLFFQSRQPHKHFEVIVRDGDMKVDGNLTVDGTIYDGSGNDLAARVEANTNAAALANSNATYAINQAGLNQTNIAANVAFINQNIGAIATNAADTSSNSFLITGLETVQIAQGASITANAEQAEDNRMDILTRIGTDRVKISDNGSFAKMLIGTAASSTISRLYISPQDSNKPLYVFIDNFLECKNLTVSTGYGGIIRFSNTPGYTNHSKIEASMANDHWKQDFYVRNHKAVTIGKNQNNSAYMILDGDLDVGDRIIIKESGFWGQMLIRTGNATISRIYFDPEDTNKPLYMILRGNLQVTGTYPSSDDRIKNNEKVIENATETLLKLKPQTYEKYEKMDCTGPYTTESGLIAQQVWYAAPELRHCVLLGRDEEGNEVVPDEMDLSDVDVANDPDYSNHGWSSTEHSAINYNSFIAYLIKSNQELHERLTVLENK